jgi:hypothetical protein
MTTLHQGKPRAQPLCYECREIPAEGKSAYCSGCAPARSPVIGGSSQCSRCFRQFAALHDYARHIVLDNSQPIAFQRCLNPAELDGEPLIQRADGVWMTARQETVRQQSADKLQAARASSTR